MRTDAIIGTDAGVVGRRTGPSDLPRRRGRGARGWRRAIGALGALFLAGALAAPAPAAARGLIRDSEIERTLRMMAEPVFEAAGLEPSSVRILIVNDPSLNAFVDGGRNMFFHAGLLSRLETPEELLGVIAHETGHITGGHVVRRIQAIRQARAKSIIASLVGIAAAAAGGGGAGAGVALGGQNIATRDLLRFTRGQESSADQAAVTFLTRAGIDPTGMLVTLRRLAEEQQVFAGAVDPYLLTHPLSGERIRALRQSVERSPARGRRVSPQIRYWHARMRAKLDGFLQRPGARGGVSYGSPEVDLYRDAIALHRLPSPDRALEAVDKLIAMRPTDAYYWELKGQILFESGRGPQAVEPYREAVKRAPRAALIRSGLGAALLTREDPAADREALKVLERAALDDPLDIRLRRSLAIAYARTGDDAMAAVVTAERLALSGRLGEARRQAQRAQKLSKVGTPGWLRAEDVLVLAGDR